MEHNLAPLGEIHIPNNWTFADAAERLALDPAPTVDDVGKWAYQTNTEECFRLMSVAPVVWKVLSPSGRYVLYTKTGTLVANATPTNKYYPSRGITLNQLEAWLDTAPEGSSALFDIIVNGTTVVGKIIIGDGVSRTTMADIVDDDNVGTTTIVLNTNEYLTIKCTQVGLDTPGSTLNVRFKGV
jgi:hypothetical protein